MAERIIGEGWARTYPTHFRGDTPDPKPCPLCGAPKGECTPEGADHGTEADTET